MRLSAPMEETGPRRNLKRHADEMDEVGLPLYEVPEPPKHAGGLLRRMFSGSFLGGIRSQPASQKRGGADSAKDASQVVRAKVAANALQTRIMDSVAGRAMNAMDMLKEVAAALPGIQVPEALNAVNDLGISFPEIAVVGQESTGKSSVLERITMLPLFPRGVDIVTRMPVRLKLRHIPGAAALERFCQTHSVSPDDKAFYIRAQMISKDTHKQVAEEATPFEAMNPESEDLLSGAPNKRIRQLMQMAATGPDGTNMGINEELILELEIQSNQLPNLVVVDLPGIVGSSVSGEPTDLAERTKRLVSQYIQKEDCLVMVVCEGCASSVRNSTAFDLVLGRGGNPPWMGKASKAIGVLTKCDACATPGQIEKLQSRVQGASRDTPELKYGYVAVVNRDSHDEAAKGPISLEQSVEREHDWFSRNLPQLLESRKATGSVLVEKLVEMLTGYVKATWAPKVFRKLEAIRCSMASEALKLGNKVPAATEEQVLLLRRVVSASMRSIRGALLGPADSPVLRKLYHDVAKSFCGEAVKDASLQNTKSPPPPRVFDGMVRRLVGETLHELGLVSSARDPSAGDWSEGLDKLDRCPALHHIFLKNISARLQDSGSDALQTVLKGAASGTNVSDRPESLQSVLLAAAVASPEVTQPPLCGHRFEKLHVALVGMVENLVASSGARSRDAAERMFATVCERSLVSSLTKSGKDSVRDVVDGALPAAASLIFAIVWHHVLCAVAAALRDAPLDDAEYLVDTLMEEEQGGLESLLSEQDHFAKKRAELDRAMTGVEKVQATIQELQGRQGSS